MRTNHHRLVLSFFLVPHPESGRWDGINVSHVKKKWPFRRVGWTCQRRCFLLEGGGWVNLKAWGEWCHQSYIKTLSQNLFLKSYPTLPVVACRRSKFQGLTSKFLSENFPFQPLSCDGKLENSAFRKIPDFVLSLKGEKILSEVITGCHVSDSFLSTPPAMQPKCGSRY